MRIEELLNLLIDGKISKEQALEGIKGFRDLGHTKLDVWREERNGFPEVVYGQGKSREQLKSILDSLKEKNNVIVTRVDIDVYEFLQDNIQNLTYFESSKILVLNYKKEIKNKGYIVVATGGTSDIAVAEEAAIVSEVLGNRVVRVYDVGVAGIHRLFSRLDEVKGANVVIAAAGMEGALISVIAGLVDSPVIALPTSVGYGANLGGLTTMLAMMNSCSSGVGVVNIDNGFGAGYLAATINRMISLGGKE